VHHRNIAYLIADGAHGRLVMWDREENDYRTYMEVAGEADLDTYARILATHLSRFAAGHRVEGVILAAPARVLGPLKAELEGGPKVLGELAKDLAGTPDHKLRDWLTAAELQAPAV
jgi:protein required for attachment to host cells